MSPNEKSGQNLQMVFLGGWRWEMGWGGVLEVMVEV